MRLLVNLTSARLRMGGAVRLPGHNRGRQHRAEGCVSQLTNGHADLVLIGGEEQACKR